MVHRVSDGTGTFEELGGWEPVLMEWLVVRAADWSEAELEFRAVKRGNVGGEVCDFWGSNTTSPKSANRCASFGKVLTSQGKPVERVPQGRGRPTYRIGSSM